jgi:hypothetical protein
MALSDDRLLRCNQLWTSLDPVEPDGHCTMMSSNQMVPENCAPRVPAWNVTCGVALLNCDADSDVEYGSQAPDAAPSRDHRQDAADAKKREVSRTRPRVGFLV